MKTTIGKKALSLLLCLVMLLSLLPAGMIQTSAKAAAVVTYPVEGGNIYFDPSTGTITDCGSTVRSAVIPDTINGIPVTTIGDSAFSYCDRLTSVTIGDSVTTIGEGAFIGCTRLTGIWVVPGNTTYSSDDCGVVFNKGKTELIQYPVGRQGSYTIPDGVTTIGNDAFHGSTGLTSVTIPNSVTTIGYEAFYSCGSLTSVTIPNSVTTIGGWAFCCCSGLTSATIPNSVTTIGYEAFSFCYGLTSVIIGDSVITIGDYAFHNCDSLTSVTIPNSVTTIGKYAFSQCSSLTSVTIEDSVTTIGERAFHNCDSLTSVTIPNSVTTIGNHAFRHCDSLTSVTIGDSVITIGDEAFYYCKSLTSVMILSANCSIYSSKDTLGRAGQTVIYGYPGSTAEAYAESWGYTFVPLLETLFEMDVSNDQVGFYLYDRSTNQPIENARISAVARGGGIRGGIAEVSTNSEGVAVAAIDTGMYELTITKEGYMTQTITKDVEAGDAYVIALTPTASTPTVFATEAKFENSYYDILTQKLILHKGSKATLDLTVYAGYANDVGIKEYWLIQDGEVKFKSSDGIFSGIKASDFSTEHSIYLAAIGNDGAKGKYIKTNLMVQENILRDNESGTDMKLEIGEEIRFTIDSDIPLIGGQEFSMSLADLPLYVEIDGDKFKAGVNLISADTSDGLGGLFQDDLTWKGFKKAIEENMDPNKYLKQMSKDKLQIKQGKGNNICVGSEGKLDFDIWGYLEGNLANGDLCGTISVTLSASIEREYQQVAFGVPIVITLELSGQVEGEIKTTTNIHNFRDLEITGSVAPSVSIAAGAGPGLAGVASLTVNGKGTLGAEFTFNKEVGNTFRSYFTASLYLKLKLLFAEWKMDIAERTFELYDSTGSKKTNQNAPLSDMMELENYSIASRTYRSNTSGWYNGAKTRSTSTQVIPLQTSVYGDTRFQMVQTENTTMLFFLTDDVERSNINRTKLVYSVYDSVLGWSEPISVEDDGTADYVPFAATDGENIFVAWMDMNAMATEKEDFGQIAAKGEIKLAEYHASTGIFTVKKLTDNTVMETLPKLTVANGTPYVVWVQNTENNMLCNDNSNNLFMYDGNNDSTTEIASAAENVLDLTIAYSNDTPVVACLQDKDGDYTTISDHNLMAFADSQTYILAQDTMVSGLDHYGEQIIWCQDGKLFGTKNVATDASVFNGLDKQVSGIYKIIETKEDTYLVFTGNALSEKPDQTDTELFAYVFDKEARSWSDAIQITDLGTTVTDYVGFVNQDEELQLVLNSSDISREGEIQETSDIYTMTMDYAPDYELISFDYSDATIGENGLVVPFYADIINNGLTSGSDYSLELCYANDVVASYHVNVPVGTGDTSVIEGTFVLSDIPQADAQFTVNVVCDNDKNVENNKQEITLGMEHVIVEITDATITGDYYLLNVNVVNKGLFTADAGINVAIGSVDGEIIATKRFTLEGGETANCLLKINASELGFDAPAKNVYVFSDTDRANGTLYVIYKPHEHNPTELPDIEPSCTESGQTGGINCPICGEVFTAPQEIAALGHAPVYTDKDAETHIITCENCDFSEEAPHSYEDGACICGRAEVEEPVLESTWKLGHSLNLASDISINYAIGKTTLAGYDMDTVYILAEIDTYKDSEKTGTKEVKLLPVVQGNYYYFVLEGMTAVNMNDEIRAVLYATKDGEVHCSPVDTYSVASYAYRQLGKAITAQKLKALCAELLRYGAKAQIYKGYRTDALVDAKMTEEQKALLSDLESVTFANTNIIETAPNTNAVQWLGKALDLASQVSVKFIFSLGSYTGSAEDLSMKVTYKDIYGTDKELIIPNVEIYNASRGYYAFTLDSMLAAELRSELTVQILSGDTVVSGTVLYTADTYGNGKTGTLGDLCKALFAYSDSAKDYFVK